MKPILLVIVTRDGSDLWKSLNDIQKRTVENVSCKVFSIDAHQICVMVEAPGGTDANAVSQNTDALNRVLDEFGASKYQVYIASHSGRVNWQEVKIAVPEKQRVDFVHEIGSEAEKVYPKLLELAQTRTLESLHKALAAIESQSEESKKKSNVRKLTILKHRIAHLFLPIDIDLQGLTETNFKQDYWNEVAVAWKGKALQTLKEARKWIYGQEQGDSVAQIVEEVISSTTDDKKKREIETAWLKIQALLPNKQNDQEASVPEVQGNAQLKQELQSLREKYKKANQILQNLDNGDKKSVQQKCQDKPNPFHKWFAELDKALDELREALGE